LSIRSALLGIIVCGLAACSSGTNSSSGVTADTIFFGGPILTMDVASPNYVEVVAVSNGIIVYAGDADGAKAMQGDSTVVRNLQGNALMPSFIDPHGHFIFAINADFVILSSDPIQASLDDIRNIKVVETIKEGETIYSK
jgi:predicted amidohydrolase YtcJ